MTRNLVIALTSLALLAAIPAAAQARSNGSVDDNGLPSCMAGVDRPCDDHGRGLDDGPNHDLNDDHGQRHGGHGADDNSNDDHGGRHGGDDDGDHGGHGGDDNSGHH